MEEKASVFVDCPVCAAPLRIPAGLLGKEGACTICGSRFTPQAPRVPEHSTSTPRTVAANETRRWAVLFALVFGPVLVLAPLSLWVGSSGTVFALRVYIMNLLMVLLLSYCVIAGLYEPEVLGRLFKVPIERKHVALIFVPLLVIESLCSLGTYSP